VDRKDDHEDHAKPVMRHGHAEHCAVHCLLLFVSEQLRAAGASKFAFTSLLSAQFDRTG
jgi:hypothetical protein